MADTTFIYALVEADTREPRYVGKADRPEARLTKHRSEAKANRDTTSKNRWLRKQFSQGRSVDIVVLAEVPTDGWEVWEQRFIAHFRLAFPRMLNITDGGDGLKNPSKEVREKIAAARRGRTNLRGYKHTPETRAKMRASQLGKKASPQARANISAAHLGLPSGMKGKRHSNETRAKMSASAHRRWS